MTGDNSFNRPNIHTRIALLTDQMEEFANRRKAELPQEHQYLVEALTMVETIRINRLCPVQICKELRAASINAERFSPVITAHLELIANEYERL